MFGWEPDSCVSTGDTGCFSVYGFEYAPGEYVSCLCKALSFLFKVCSFTVRDTLPGQVITSNHGQSEEQVSVLAQQNAVQTAHSCQFAAMAANAEAQVGQRPVPDEPMYVTLL
jgi:hypothetical protein